MKTLEEKVLDLEKKLAQKTDQDELNEFERAKREVKEEASKREKVNIDLLHEKLIVLERLSRKNDKDCQEKISLILWRFHTHINTPSFAAALVLKLICSKEEEIILEKEQKLLKSFVQGRRKIQFQIPEPRIVTVWVNQTLHLLITFLICIWMFHPSLVLWITCNLFHNSHFQCLLLICYPSLVVMPQEGSNLGIVYLSALNAKRLVILWKIVNKINKLCVYLTLHASI